MNSYRLTAEARRDLLQIWNYLATNSIDAVDKLRNEILADIRLLASHPGIGHERPDVRNPRYRFWPLRSYVIAYFPDTRPLTVVRIIHGSRNIKSLFRGR